jgi:hypothetical protein
MRPVELIELSEQDWEKLEVTLTQSIPPEARARITVMTNSFLESAVAECNAGSMNDAIERASRLRERAKAFISVIEERAEDDPTRGYVDETLAMSYARLSSEDPSPAFFYGVSAWLTLFVNACDLTLQSVKRDAQRNYWPEGGAWEHWIRQLTDILEAHHLPTGVSKDTRSKAARSKATGARLTRSEAARPKTVSPFVECVYTLQTLLPKKYVRGQHSRGALALAIYRARAKPKPPLSPRKGRARKCGSH